jgi:IS30 family transposase
LLESNVFHIKNFDKLFDSCKEIEIEKGALAPVKLDNKFKNAIRELHSKGWSYAKIGEKLGISRSAASGIIHRAKINKNKGRGKYD